MLRDTLGTLAALAAVVGLIAFLIGIASLVVPNKSVREDPTRCVRYQNVVVPAHRNPANDLMVPESTNDVCTAWELCIAPCNQGEVCGDYTCTKTQGWMK